VILFSLALLLLLGYMVNHSRRPRMEDYPKPFFKVPAPALKCESCGCHPVFTNCGPHRFVHCDRYRMNVSAVGDCKKWVAKA
jgi:hypothetical protein